MRVWWGGEGASEDYAGRANRDLWAGARSVAALLADGGDDFGEFGFGDFVEEGEAQEAVADVFGDGAVAGAAGELAAHVGEMQRQVVEDGKDAFGFEARDQI